MKKFIVFLLMLCLVSAMAFTAGEAEKEEVSMEKMDKITFSTWLFYQLPEEEQAFEEQFKRDTGVTLEIINIPKADWEDTLQAMFVAGDFADVTLTPDNISPLIRQGFLVPIEDYINADPDFKELREKLPHVFRKGLHNGISYGMANGTGSYMNYWIRKDWLDKLGLDMPKSMDEVVSMLEAFKNADFNKDNSVIPLVITNSIWNHDVFSSYFGVFNEVVKVDGKFQDSYLTPEFKEYADFMRDLYARGLLDQEMPTNGYGDCRKKVQEGFGGSIVMWDDSYDSFANGMRNNGVEGEALPVPPFKGKKEGTVFGLSYDPPGTSFSITSNAKNPKFVFDTFFDWFYMQESGIVATSRGVEGLNFTVENGILTPTEYSRVGNKGQKFPPVKPGFEYPFKFDPVSQGEYDNIKKVREWAAPFFADTDKIYPPLEATEYWAMESDLYDKKRSVIGKYIMGEYDYEGFTDEYTRYINEMQLPRILDELNSK